ncbi:MAG TPA: SigB/SigF/SigG family RNA polymerase sigma factor [Solirubrobacteraceae bacterium]|nr:SigB/SigF/SigG family RNA polymerase sigma factor [Solirubrobacteraceae bacterium]
MSAITRGDPLRLASTEELFERFTRDRDPHVREELTRRFLPLARKLARRYNGAREPFDDLLQVACVGLVKALDRYDVGRGTAFSSLAVPTILGELKRYFRDLGWAVHVPRGAQELAVKVEDCSQQLASRDGRPPSVQTLAQYMDLPLEDVVDALETARAHHAASLDAPHDDGEGENGSLVDTFGRADPRLLAAEERLTVCAAAKLLSQREREVLCLRFVEDLTQSEISARIGVSQMQVSRILRRSLARLRELADD